MKLVLKKEMETEEQLRQYVKDNKIDMPDFKCAVVAMLMDKEERIIFQRRGPKSRDGSGMLAEISGAVENYDKTFREALKRELKEEVGENVTIYIDDFVGGFLHTKYDSRSGKDVNWLFLLYKCTYISGQLQCKEKGKSLEYVFYKKDNLPLNEMLETTQYFCNYYFLNYHKCYSYVMGVENIMQYLDSQLFTILEDDGDYTVVFDEKYKDIFEQFIISQLEIGYWNEYIIDEKIVFHFKESEDCIQKYVLGKDNNKEILNKCRSYADSDFESIRKMFFDNDFYKKYIDGVVFYD